MAAKLNHLHKSPHFPPFLMAQAELLIRAMGLRDECVNDYSQEWGHRPYRSIMLVLVLSHSPPSLPFCFCLHSQSYTPFTSLTYV